jgi:nicotinamide N-methyltransferase
MYEGDGECGSDDDESSMMNITVGAVQLRVTTAENDFNAEKKVLFATYVWNGAKVLGEFILSDGAPMISGRTVVELGAGAGIPSICAYHAGALRVCATDYPVDDLIDNLQSNIERNVPEAAVRDKRVATQGYMWNTDARDVLKMSRDNGGLANEDAYVKDMQSLSPPSVGYDVAIAAECLWKHDIHAELIHSLSSLVRPGGKVIISFSNHIPGLEKEDISFFAKAEAMCGAKVIQKNDYPAKHMWSDRETTIHVYVLQMPESQR